MFFYHGIVRCNEGCRNLIEQNQLTMKRMLLFIMAATCLSMVHAQESKKKNTAYAITGVQKGSSSWTEVRLVDIATGEEVQSVYQSAQTVEALNARTGKPIVKKDLHASNLKEVSPA